VTAHVTRLAMTRTAEPSRLDITAIEGMEYWRVEWTLSTNGRDHENAMSHYTEKAARRHVDGLLKRRPPGVEISDVYSEGRVP
jgi:hypothetical protein